MHRPRMITFAAFLWIGMIAALLLSDINSTPVAAQSPQGAQTAAAAMVAAQVLPDPQAGQPPVEIPNVDPVAASLLPATALSRSPEAVAAPYNDYTVSQGPHGFSYGHAAIDLTAGNGAPILSPINGSVTQNFIDYLGNTTLVIENEVYQVTLMHGLYTAQVGDDLIIGQIVGSESNQGNTVDWWGRSCQGRDCGYHTHWNMFDKRIGSNVNPLNLIP